MLELMMSSFVLSISTGNYSWIQFYYSANVRSITGYFSCNNCLKIDGCVGGCRWNISRCYIILLFGFPKQEIHDSRRVKITAEGAVHKLVIVNPQVIDSGKYRVECMGIPSNAHLQVDGKSFRSHRTWIQYKNQSIMYIYWYDAVMDFANRYFNTIL
jgi:hypothetical protein